MEDIIRKIIEAGMDNVIEVRKNPLLRNDEIYQNDMKDLAEIEEKYMSLDLPKEAKRVIDDYIACAQTTYGRANDLCYIIGIRDTVLFLNQMGLLKENLNQ